MSNMRDDRWKVSTLIIPGLAASGWPAAPPWLPKPPSPPSPPSGADPGIGPQTRDLDPEGGPTARHQRRPSLRKSRCCVG